MSNNLLVVPLEFKDKIEKKEQSVIKKLIKEYEEFYIEKDSLENFKAYIQKNLPKTVSFFKSNITTDSDFIRALKSLSQETKIILVSPQISNLKEYISKERELYDEVYQLLETSSVIIGFAPLQFVNVRCAVVSVCFEFQSSIEEELPDVILVKFV